MSADAEKRRHFKTTHFQLSFGDNYTAHPVGDLSSWHGLNSVSSRARQPVDRSAKMCCVHLNMLKLSVSL